MKQSTLRVVAIIAMSLSLQPVAWASGWSRALTVTSIAEINVGGEVILVSVGELVDNTGHCATPIGYAIRDSATLKGSLALLTSALVAGRQVNLFVTGTCDATGRPSVIGVTLH